MTYVTDHDRHRRFLQRRINCKKSTFLCVMTHCWLIGLQQRSAIRYLNECYVRWDLGRTKVVKLMC